MIVYLYSCPDCKARAEELREVADRNNPIPCRCGRVMRRTFTPPVFTANRACDLIENRIYHGDKEDVRRQQKADDIAYEKATANWDLSPPKPKTMDDILSSGIVQAAKTKEGLMQWRKEHIPADAEPVNA